MDFLKLKNVSKIYKQKGKEDFYSIKNISLSFKSVGLVVIKGKSGSGKSTLINLISSIDKVSQGNIFYSRNDICKYSQKEKNHYRNSSIGLVYQHYNLLEDFDVLFNISVPLLVNNVKTKDARKKVEELLTKFGLIEFKNKKTKNLSGGEKQRVAIMRALINSPSVLLCDEPTGALDNENAIKIMDILKEISKTKCVIVASHDDNLIKKYSDRIITLNEGQVISDVAINDSRRNLIINESKERKTNTWTRKYSIQNLRRHLKKNCFVFFSCLISFVSISLAIGFSNGANATIQEQKNNFIDNDVLKLTKKININQNEQGINLQQIVRPSLGDALSLFNEYKSIHVENNYEALLPNYPLMDINGNKYDDIAFFPLFDFTSERKYQKYSIVGECPDEDVLNKVIVNKQLIDKIGIKQEEYKNIVISISYTISFDYPTNNSLKPIISDYYVFKQVFKIAYIIEEMPFLEGPKVFYSYKAFESHLAEINVNNLSMFLKKNTTWKEYVSNAYSTHPITSYSYYVYVEKENDIQSLKLMSESLINTNSEYEITSNAFLIEDSFVSLIQSASTGMSIFIITAIMGTLIIIGLVAYSSFAELKKEVVILRSLGVNQGAIGTSFIVENLIVVLISLVIAFVLSLSFSPLLNMLFSSFFGFENLINIPFLKMFNIPFLLPLLFLFISVIIVSLCVFLPLMTINKIDLAKELKEYD